MLALTRWARQTALARTGRRTVELQFRMRVEMSSSVRDKLSHIASKQPAVAAADTSHSDIDESWVCWPVHETIAMT